MRVVQAAIISAFIFSSFILPAYAEGEVQAAEAVGQAPIERSDRLTLELQGTSILDVFKLLSKRSGLNIVAGKNVQGQVSIYLQDVPVREALRTILQSQGLASIEEGGIINVVTADEYLKQFGRPYGDIRVTKFFKLNYASAEILAAKLSDNRTAFGKIITEPRTNTLIITELPDVLSEMEKMIVESDQPQQTEVFRLNYTKAEDLEPKIKTFMDGTSGKVEIDKRSNRIVVSDIPSRIQLIQSLVEAFDVKTAQVLIDAKIVEVHLSDEYRKGIDWQKLFTEIGDVGTASAVIPLTVSPPSGVTVLPTLTLSSNGDDFKAILSLLEKVGKTNLLSSPRITVMDNEEAKLAVATREPYVSQTVIQTTTSTNTADNVQFVDVGVTLKVQPRISQNEFVGMKIRPEVSSSNRTLELEGVSAGSDTTFTRTRIPVVTTQELETTVLIKSGHTLVLGGLIQDRQRKVSTRVPIIGYLPVIGRAFESNTDDFTKTELVVFLTPRIMDPAESTKEDQQFLTPKGDLKVFDAVGNVPAPMPDGLLASKKGPYWQGSEK